MGRPFSEGRSLHPYPSWKGCRGDGKLVHAKRLCTNSSTVRGMMPTTNNFHNSIIVESACVRACVCEQFFIGSLMRITSIFLKSLLSIFFKYKNSISFAFAPLPAGISWKPRRVRRLKSKSCCQLCVTQETTVIAWNIRQKHYLGHVKVSFAPAVRVSPIIINSFQTL